MKNKIELTSKLLKGDTNGIVNIIPEKNKIKLLLYLTDINARKQVENMTNNAVSSEENFYKMKKLMTKIDNQMTEKNINKKSLDEIASFICCNKELKDDIDDYLNFILPKINNSFLKIIMPLIAL